MVTGNLFRQCLSEVFKETRAEFELSFEIAERLDAILREKGISQHNLAVMLGKRDSEISKWLTGRHNFTTNTIARIETAIGSRLVSVTR
mgnify:CR=1 FL=1